MDSFKFENNIKIISGKSAVSNLPFELSQAGCDRPMLICDESSYRVGFFDEIKRSLNIADIEISTTFYKIADIFVCPHKNAQVISAILHINCADY